MDPKTLQSLAQELAKEVKTEADLNELSRALKKLVVESALNAELRAHLGYDKHDAKRATNTRNGYSSKTVTTDEGELTLAIPRDREGSFEPQLIKKHQTRFTSMDEQILFFYAKGLTTREITATFKELYDADVSPTLVSQVTDAVLDTLVTWQNRPLDPLYPVVYLDGIVVKVRQDNRFISKTVYLALGINLKGDKELLGLWIAENEGAKFWLGVLTELKNRGLDDILITCVDGLKGFPEAIRVVYPQSQVQLCIVHMVRNSLRYVSYKDRQAVIKDLQRIYQSPTEEGGRQALDALASHWDEKYPHVSGSWYAHWDNLSTFYHYPPEIRKVIYTTNTIESLNSVLRQTLNKRKTFTHDNSVKKVIFLAIQSAAKNWRRPIKEWNMALGRFIVEFGERLAPYI